MNLNSYLVRESQHIDACYLSLTAAEELFGENSFEYKQVMKAWYAVGLLKPEELGINGARTTYNWKLWPNPGSGVFTVTHPENYTSTKIEVYDISGKLLLQKSVLPGTACDISELSKGIYFVRVNDETVFRYILN
jgi:hypothetical protein